MNFRLTCPPDPATLPSITLHHHPEPNAKDVPSTPVLLQSLLTTIHQRHEQRPFTITDLEHALLSIQSAQTLRPSLSAWLSYLITCLTSQGYLTIEATASREPVTFHPGTPVSIRSKAGWTYLARNAAQDGEQGIVTTTSDTSAEVWLFHHPRALTFSLDELQILPVKQPGDDQMLLIWTPETGVITSEYNRKGVHNLREYENTLQKALQHARRTGHSTYLLSPIATVHNRHHINIEEHGLRPPSSTPVTQTMPLGRAEETPTEPQESMSCNF